MSNTSLLGSFGGQAGESLMFRNRIINGDMRIDQRNSGASSSPADETYTLDRWSVRKVGAGNFSIQQRTTQSGAANFEAGSAPGGFTHSIKVTTTTQDTVMDANDVYALAQAFEGLNVGDLGWGTASAQTITVSFWVKSTFAGVYGLALSNPLTDAGYSVLYTINSANTWEYKTIIIPGPTSGTFKTDNTACFRVAWSLGCGSARLTTPNSWVAANSVGATGQGNFMGQSVGATFHLTGVQLEAGPTATPFERRPYSVELQMAMRYAQFNLPGNGYSNATTIVSTAVPVAVPMRVNLAAANLAIVNSSALVDYNIAVRVISGFGTLTGSTNTGLVVDINSASTTVNKPHALIGGCIFVSAEL